MNTSIAIPPTSKVRQNKDEPDSPSEICQSPSWSDHGEEKRRKEKKKKTDKVQKEHMDLEKRRKKEEDKQKQAAIKAGKRLSKKPPPAAMDTQRMPTALRRTVTESSTSPKTSSNDSHRSFNDDRRSSLTSIVSFMGFSKSSSRRNSLLQSDSPTMNHHFANFTTSPAEESPGILEGPRRESSNTHHSENSDSDKLYDKDIIEFAYQLEASTKLAQINDSKPVKQVRISNPSNVSTSNTPSSKLNTKTTHSRDPGQDASAEKKPLRPILVNRDSSDGALAKKSDGDQKNSNPVQEPTTGLDKDVTAKPTVIDDLAQYRGIKSAIALPKNSPGAPSPRGRQSYDGNSYVQKQRMYQQQRSIAGYEDELAIVGANAPSERTRSQMNQHQIWPPTPQDSAESLHHDAIQSNQKKAEVVERTNTQRNISSLNKTIPSKSSATNEPQAPESNDQLPNAQAKKKSESKSKNDGNTENAGQSGSAKREHSRTRTKSSRPPTQDLEPRKVHSGSSSTSAQPVDRQTTLPRSSTVVADSSSKPPSDRKAEKREINKAAHSKKGSISKEVVIEGVDGDGLVRKTSLKRPRSDPQLQVSVKIPKLPSLDFLPVLKHQPLTKPKRTSHLRTTTGGTSAEATPPASSSQFPVSSSTFAHSTSVHSSDPQNIVKLPFAPSRSRAESPSKASNARSRSSDPSTIQLHPSHPSPVKGSSLAPKPIAKMFVICCKCKYWHDLPSRLYEAMALPRKIQPGDKIAQSVGAKTGGEGKGKGIEGKVFTTVNCPWCAHGMNTACCAGWTTVVYLHERHH